MENQNLTREKAKVLLGITDNDIRFAIGKLQKERDRLVNQIETYKERLEDIITFIDQYRKLI